MRLLSLLLLLLLCAALTRAGNGGDLAITAPGTIWTTDERVLFAWNTGKSTFTVRILVNSHETLETKSIKDKSFSWQPDKLKAGDKVQVWVYDSAGASGKTAQIAVQQGGGGSSGGSGDDGEGGEGESAKPTGTASKAEPTSSKAGGGGKASVTGSSAAGGSAADDEGGSTSSREASASTGGGAKATASASGGVDEEQEAAESSATSEALAALTAGSSATSATALPTASATGTVDAATSGDSDSLSEASSSQDPTSITGTSDRKTLYLGLGGLVLAFLLGIAIYLWWRQSQPSPARERRRDRRDERSLGKRPRTRQTPNLAVVPSVERAALLSDDLERGSAGSPSSASSASSGRWSDEGEERGRRRKGGAG
ncbi:hypothetical protein JCM3775_006936 [Rhodotorula graminis]